MLFKKNKIEKTISIEGMSCDHCKLRIEQALKKIKGITDAKVSLAQKNATITMTKDISKEELQQVIKDLGYHVI